MLGALKERFGNEAIESVVELVSDATTPIAEDTFLVPVEEVR